MSSNEQKNVLGNIHALAPVPCSAFKLAAAVAKTRLKSGDYPGLRLQLKDLMKPIDITIICAANKLSTFPMASIHTRSLRKSEAFTTRSSPRSNVAAPPINNNNDTYNRPRQSNIGRRKRARAESEDEVDTIKNKKAKITVQFRRRPQIQAKTRSLVIKDNAKSDVVVTPASPTPEVLLDTAPQPNPPTSKKVPPIHQQKVANGIKHELDRLQPNAADLKDEKRKLRSQEGTRFKSELSAYFPEYDEVIGNDPKDDCK
jgi:hypothetical protein